MSTTTTNYGLIKPDTTDPILIGQLNDNADAIDTVLKDHSDKINAAALGIKYKGEVNYYADLPNSAKIGDAYTVKYAGSSGTTPDGTEYVWGTASGTNQWINFSKDSYTKAEVDALLALKQNALSSTQLAAVNSGIDSTKVAQIETNKNNILLLNQYGGGFNKLRNTAASTGIFTVNEDGSVTISGSTGSSHAVLQIGTFTGYANQWYLGGISGGSSTTYYIDVLDGAHQKQAHSGYVLIPFDYTNASVRIVVAPNQTVNTTIYPMIISEDDYAINPNPHYQPYALSNAELTAAIQAIQAQLANQ